MSLPEYIENTLTQIRNAMLADTKHNIGILERQSLYEQLEADYKINKQIIGWLGLLTTKKILSVWNNELAVWDGIENEFGIPDVKNLPVEMLQLAEDILTLKKTIPEGLELLDVYHGVLGAVADEILDYREDAPKRIVFVADAAYNTLTSLLGFGTTKNIRGLEHLTDDELPSELLDVAGTAAIAYSGGNESGAINLEKRKEFWEWWLTEAIPQAWELAAK